MSEVFLITYHQAKFYKLIKLYLLLKNLTSLVHNARLPRQFSGEYGCKTIPEDCGALGKPYGGLPFFGINIVHSKY